MLVDIAVQQLTIRVLQFNTTLRFELSIKATPVAVEEHSHKQMYTCCNSIATQQQPDKQRHTMRLLLSRINMLKALTGE